LGINGLASATNDCVKGSGLTFLLVQCPHTTSEPVGIPLRVETTSVFNRDQWIESFEGQLSILRPHLTPRVLETMSLAAWHEVGRAEVDPIEAARELSKLLDERKAAPG
jgi:hypothetical protein